MAVYTPVSDQDIAALLKRYDIGHARSLKGIAEGVENSNFFLLTDKGSYILTLYEKRVREEDLPFFLGLTEHLAKQEVPCPLPIRDRDGGIIQKVNGRPAAIIEFLIGTWPKVIQHWQLPLLGEALAKMHLAVETFPLSRPNALGLAGWKALAEKVGTRFEEIEPGLSTLVKEELAFLEAHWPKSLPQGVVHADLFPDNVFFDEGRLTGVIDFYFACNDFFAYDLIITMNAWCFAPDYAFRFEEAKALMQTYQTRRMLTQEELRALPVLARGAAFRFLLTRAHDWVFHEQGAMVTPKDPREYLAKLKFHRNVKGPEAYGA